jgi:DNA polymerase-4
VLLLPTGGTALLPPPEKQKKLGIGTGTRRHDAIRLCPEFQFIPADFNKYWQISQKFLQVCKNYSPFIEVFSIDELFMDASRTAHLFGGPHELVKKLKKHLAREVGEYISVSVGISYNKLLAKLGSGMKKPNGVVEITPAQVPYVYKIAKLQDICGIGPRIERRLHQMGIYSLTQLSKTHLPTLIAEFGNVEGNFLYHVGQGTDTQIVKPYNMLEDAKSVSRNYCLPENEYDGRIVLQNVYELCEELGIKLRRLGKKARHAGLYLRGRNSGGIDKTFTHYFDTGKDLFHVLMTLIEQQFLTQLADNQELQNKLKQGTLSELAWLYFFRDLGYVRQISVWVSYLVDKDKTSLNMFYDDLKYDKVIRTVDTLNEKFGDHTVRNAFLLYANKLTTVPNGYMADRYERMKLATSDQE